MFGGKQPDKLEDQFPRAFVRIILSLGKEIREHTFSRAAALAAECTMSVGSLSMGGFHSRARCGMGGASLDAQKSSPPYKTASCTKATEYSVLSFIDHMGQTQKCTFSVEAFESVA